MTEESKKPEIAPPFARRLRHTAAWLHLPRFLAAAVILFAVGFFWSASHPVPPVETGQAVSNVLPQPKPSPIPSPKPSVPVKQVAVKSANLVKPAKLVKPVSVPSRVHSLIVRKASRRHTAVVPASFRARHTKHSEHRKHGRRGHGKGHGHGKHGRHR